MIIQIVIVLIILVIIAYYFLYSSTKAPVANLSAVKDIVTEFTKAEKVAAPTDADYIDAATQIKTKYPNITDYKSFQNLTKENNDAALDLFKLLGKKAKVEWSTTSDADLGALVSGSTSNTLSCIKSAVGANPRIERYPAFYLNWLKSKNPQLLSQVQIPAVAEFNQWAAGVQACKPV